MVEAPNVLKVRECPADPSKVPHGPLRGSRMSPDYSTLGTQGACAYAEEA